MEENSVTVDGITHRIEPPYTVIATQNPVGSAGTQLLPESQLDRFMVRLSLGYPAMDDEISMLKRKGGENPLEFVRRVADVGHIREMQREVDSVYVDDDIYAYIAQIAWATREDERLHMGVSPRASLALLSMSKAAAWFAGRDYVVPKDIDTVLPDVLEHRITMNLRASAEGEAVRDVLADIVKKTPRPQIIPQKSTAIHRSLGA
jgi:MoxR-like ATPase